MELANLRNLLFNLFASHSLQPEGISIVNPWEEESFNSMVAFWAEDAGLDDRHCHQEMRLMRIARDSWRMPALDKTTDAIRMRIRKHRSDGTETSKAFCESTEWMRDRFARESLTTKRSRDDAVDLLGRRRFRGVIGNFVLRSEMPS